MASLQSRLSDLITAIGTDIKLLRTYITGSSTGDLSGLSTTAKTSIIAAINEVQAASGSPASASESAAGVAELATQSETNTGTDDARIVTPLKFQTRMAAYAMPLSYLDTDTSLAANSDSKVASQKAVKAYADALIGAANAMVYKGVIDASGNPNYPAANAGDTYRISVAGKIGGASGTNVEVGDLIVCLTDSTSAGTQAAVGSNWNITQANIDGAVVGPASSTSNNLTSFSGTTGKVVQDSGFSASNSAIGAGSATVLPTSAQVVAYAQPIDADLTAIAALTSAADKVPYSTGAQAWALATLTSYARTLLDDTDAATARGTLSVYSQAELGNPDTDLAALYTTAKS